MYMYNVTYFCFLNVLLKYMVMCAMSEIYPKIAGYAGKKSKCTMSCLNSDRWIRFVFILDSCVHVYI